MTWNLDRALLHIGIISHTVAPSLKTALAIHNIADRTREKGYSTC